VPPGARRPARSCDSCPPWVRPGSSADRRQEPVRPRRSAPERAVRRRGEVLPAAPTRPVGHEPVSSGEHLVGRPARSPTVSCTCSMSNHIDRAYISQWYGANGVRRSAALACMAAAAVRRAAGGPVRPWPRQAQVLEGFPHRRGRSVPALKMDGPERRLPAGRRRRGRRRDELVAALCRRRRSGRHRRRSSRRGCQAPRPRIVRGGRSRRPGRRGRPHAHRAACPRRSLLGLGDGGADRVGLGHAELRRRRVHHLRHPGLPAARAGAVDVDRPGVRVPSAAPGPRCGTRRRHRHGLATWRSSRCRPAHPRRLARFLDVDVQTRRRRPRLQVLGHQAPEVAVAPGDEAPHSASPCSRHQRTLRRMPSSSAICGS
jgi:hypothetical protein